MISPGLIFKGLINLIYPLCCQTCGLKLELTNTRYLCESCWNKISKNQSPFCIKCGMTLPGSAQEKPQCGGCSKKDYVFTRAWSTGLYQGILKECIHLLKYGKKVFMAVPLGKLMADFINRYLDLGNIDLIIPVPLHPARLREREFNQSALLAEQINKRFNIPLSLNNLVKTRPTRPQTGLSGKERLANIQLAFKIKNSSLFSEKNVLLVDDVFTTGSTINECSNTLLRSGINNIYVLTLARAN